ncbi:MAG: hypothetical protein ISS93_03395 [Candidatus Aenigmarchaeota archaeon]|nr:hypothetical protein [Candidatus Aenigmarchaeota archaeon]
MKAQMGIMEYIIMTFFMVVVIIVIIFFLIGFQVGQFTLQKHGSETDRALALSKQIVSSPLFVKEESVFDDGKLTSLTTLGNICPELEAMFGNDWFFEITVLDSQPIVPCTRNSYPNCNYWAFCVQDENSISFDFPVNIHRSIGFSDSTGIFSRTDIGIIKAGIYVN